MNKKIKIEKQVDMKNKIEKIIEIQLEKQINKIEQDKIEGNLLLTGKYNNEINEVEDFSYEIPIEINIIEKVDKNSIDIQISDFSYEINNQNSINCSIELTIEGVEILEESRECDGDSKEEKEIEIPHLDNNDENKIREEVKKEKTINEEKSLSFFDIDAEEETYGTFLVYILRENETINTIIEKYHTKLEDIEKYNDIKSISTGSKIIIPFTNEQDS